MRVHDEEVAADLRFYFRDAAGAMGLKSNFAGMIASLEGGGYTPRASHEVDDRKLEAARRARRVHETLEACPVAARVVLGIAYRYPEGEQLLLGATTVAADAHRKSRSRRPLLDWLERARKSDDEEKRLVYRVLRERMQEVLTEALGQYVRIQKELAQRRRGRAGSAT